MARGRQLYRQRFSRGIPQGPLEKLGEVHNRRGTRTRFHPDAEIFGKDAAFEPARIYRMARSKAYLFGGVTMLQFALQGQGVDVPAQLLAMLPYLATIVVLALISRNATFIRVNMPASLTSCWRTFHFT